MPGDSATQARLWERGVEGRTENPCRKAGAVYEDTDPKCEECGAGAGAQPAWSRCEWHEETGGLARLGQRQSLRCLGFVLKATCSQPSGGVGPHLNIHSKQVARQWCGVQERPTPAEQTSLLQSSMTAKMEGGGGSDPNHFLLFPG